MAPKDARFSDWFEWILSIVDMTPENRRFIDTCSVAARMVAHPYPDAVACEAALESNYGHSHAMLVGNNPLSLKTFEHPTYGQVSLPAKEFLHPDWIPNDGFLIHYPSLADCFADRLATLVRLKQIYPTYKEALEADTVDGYITAVSKTWLHDLDRSLKVMIIYRRYITDHFNT